MIDKKFSIGKKMMTVFKSFPSMRFRDGEPTIHNASDATACGRKMTYKALGVTPSNPTDNLGQLRMRFGSWIERGLAYEAIAKMPSLGVVTLSTQGSAGEHGTFYGTSWHGYRDFDIAIAQVNKAGDVQYKPVIVELKTKVGIGAKMMVCKSAYSKFYKDDVMPDTDWGQAQQLSLYLRDAYLKTKDNKSFKTPIVDGILAVFLYADGLCGMVEFYAEYLPETDTVHFYRRHCYEIPELDGEIDLTITLKDIADRWIEHDKYLAAGELAPPDFERKYDVHDDRIANLPKYKIELACKNEMVLGDVQCSYCPFKDKCAQDLEIDLTYTADELKILRGHTKKETVAKKKVARKKAVKRKSIRRKSNGKETEE